MYYFTLINKYDKLELSGVTKIRNVGGLADFIVTKENPLEDLKVLRKVEMVVFRGKEIKNPKVKKFEDVEKQLDLYM